MNETKVNMNETEVKGSPGSLPNLSGPVIRGDCMSFVSPMSKPVREDTEKKKKPSLNLKDYPELAVLDKNPDKYQPQEYRVYYAAGQYVNAGFAAIDGIKTAQSMTHKLYCLYLAVRCMEKLYKEKPYFKTGLQMLNSIIYETVENLSKEINAQEDKNSRARYMELLDGLNSAFKELKKKTNLYQK